MSIIATSALSIIDEGTDQLFLDMQDPRDKMTRTWDLCSAIFKELRSRWQRRYHPDKGKALSLYPVPRWEGLSLIYNDNEYPWCQRSSSGLVVFIHGLNSSPLTWTKYCKIIQERNPGILCFAPNVYKKGYCSVKRAAEPILKAVRNYQQGNPDAPIWLVGHSFGAKIAARIECKLGAKNIVVISIAGPHGGTALQKIIHRLGADGLFGLSAELLQELIPYGEKSLKACRKWQKHSIRNFSSACRRIFYAAVEDGCIFPSQLCFPRLVNSSYHLVAAQTHTTIVDAVCEDVCDKIKFYS